MMNPEKMPLGARWRGVWARLKMRMNFFIGERLPPRETQPGPEYRGRTIYLCPRCGEFVYYPKKCVSCGQRFTGQPITIGQAMEDG